jgi:cytochrome c-type biogenesis protein CcmH
MRRWTPNPSREAIEQLSRSKRFTGVSLATALSALALAATLVATLIVPLLVPTRPADAAATSRQEIAEALTCQCGCGLTVANCNHPNCSFSVPMREHIDTMLAHGMGRAEIISYFRKQYGEKVLSAPTAQGFNLLAWTMPFVALMIGGGLVVLMMGRWRGAPSTPGSASESAPDASGKPDAADKFDPTLRERLERELRERR